MDFVINLFGTFWVQSIFKLFLGFILAGVIGLERSSWNKPAGFRTHALLGISSVLVMLCGEYMATAYDIDPSRIPAQLLSGIGFIGAGTILRDGFNVKGLTTAAGLLAVTCIGLSIGAGFYLGGIVSTIIIYIVLSYSYKISEKLEHFDTFDFDIKISNSNTDTFEKIEKILSKNDFDIKHIKRENQDETEELIQISGQFNKKESNKNKLISSISSLENVIEIVET